MNRPQKILTIVFLVLFTLTFFWLPVFPDTHDSEDPFPSALYWQPDYFSKDDRLAMYLEWLWLAVMYAGLFSLVKPTQTESIK